MDNQNWIDELERELNAKSFEAEIPKEKPKHGPEHPCARTPEQAPAGFDFQFTLRTDGEGRHFAKFQNAAGDTQEFEIPCEAFSGIVMSNQELIAALAIRQALIDGSIELNNEEGGE